MANKASGKGYENESFYSDIKFMFLGIENIHVMRSSLQKLIDGIFFIFSFQEDFLTILHFLQKKSN